MIRVRGVTRAFGGVRAVDSVSLTVPRGELRGVIGPNGAGKSTLFNLITGHVLPDSGLIELEGRRIDRLAPHRRAQLGVSIVFQGARLFPAMTVLENVAVGAQARTSAGALAAVLRTRRQRAEERQIFDDAREALALVGLSEWADQSSAQLPLGHQRRLQVARALTARPSVLLLDEPASGLRATEREDLTALIRQVTGLGTTVLIIEHDVAMVMSLVDRVTVLDLGRVIAEGTPDEVRRDPAVIRAYLGEEVTAR